MWFGWSGHITSEPSPQRKTPDVTDVNGEYRCVTFDLTQSQYEGFYEEFANRSLWPVLHNRLDLASFSKRAFETYRDVNGLFCDGLRPHLQADDLIWVHDYHLILVARQLRNNGVTSPLGFFLHTPCPPPEVLQAVPWWRELVDGLLAYDVVGFQTERDVQNFLDLVAREFGGEVTGRNRVRVGTWECGVADFPIGIDPASFAELAVGEAGRELGEHLADWYADRQIIIGVDRLDYTKGLDRRFRAFETFLEQSPEHRGTVAFLQIAAPSREDVPEYVYMREELEALSGHINGHFSELDWQPLRYLNKSFDQNALAALYRLSRVGLVTPLRDGMNIVAKEYVAAQDPSDPGVLILSKFSGAAEELHDALIVNPYDIAGVADAMKTAVEMPIEERRRRHGRLFAALENNTVHDWCQRFLDTLMDRDSVRDAPASDQGAKTRGMSHGQD